MIAKTGPIPSALVAEQDRLDQAVRDWPKARPIVTLCACPQDATAVQAARNLLAQGFASVRPLKGGYEAWSKHMQRSGSVTSVMSIQLPLGHLLPRDEQKQVAKDTAADACTKLPKRGSL